MKKVISILFLLCFVITTPCGAQGKSPVRLFKDTKKLIDGFRPIPHPVPLPIPVPVSPKWVGANVILYTQDIIQQATPLPSSQIGKLRMPTQRDMQIGRALLSTQRESQLVKDFQMLNLYKANHDLSLEMLFPAQVPEEERGFIPEKHLSSPSTTNKQPIAPKFNSDEIRMKLKMKGDRINIKEMKSDGLIFISLLNYHNEYGENYITGCAA